MIFPVLHGPYGEDGTVQGMLEMANLPYVGSGVLASACGMDKEVAKRLFAGAGLPQVPFVLLPRSMWRSNPGDCFAKVETALSYPVFVKPANLGSSVGISKARDRGQLAEALDLAAQFDRKLLVEAAVPHARELEVSVLGNDAPIASVPGEIVPGNEFYDYNAKYIDDNSELLIPAPLAAATVQQTAGVCRTCVCRTGLCRAGARGLSHERGERRAVLERNQHDAGLHPDQHVSKTVGGKRYQLSRTRRQARTTGVGALRRSPGEQHGALSAVRWTQQVTATSGKHG